MKYSKYVMSFIGMVLLLVWNQAAVAGDKFHHRQKKQYQRIYSGIRQGQITPKEFYRLNKQQWHIDQFKRQAEADGWLDRRERRRLHHLQKKAGRHIYLAKHNHRQVGQRVPGPKRRHTNHHDYLMDEEDPSDQTVVYLRGHISHPDWNFAWKMADY
jgi:hypothetical protein